MAKIIKQRMFTSEQWRDKFIESKKAASDIEAAVGIPKVVFLRAIQPNGEQIPIPFKYEFPLYEYFKSCMKELEPIITEEIKPSALSDEDIKNKHTWLRKLKEARLAI